MNAKHTGDVPKQSCSPRPAPALLDSGFASGAKACVPLLLLRQGLGVSSKALAALLRLCSLWVDYRSLCGDLTAKLPNVALPEPLLSHPLSSGHTGGCTEQP